MLNYRKRGSFLFIILFFAGLFISETGDVLAEEVLPSLSLAVPASKEQRVYLGLTGAPGENFGPDDIKADILLIELFSMYCPYCQAEAPNVNALFQLMEEKDKSGVILKIIGLGASNTAFEVDQFREAFDIKFPLFPDKSLEMYKKLGGEGTPGFLGIRLKKGEKPLIVLRQSGGFDSAEEFLSLLLQRAGY